MTEQAYIPYGRQAISDEDIATVVAVLKSDWLTTGPNVANFEAAFATQCGVDHAVAVNSGTAALHCAMYAIDLKPGDEVIVPSMTFAATANSVLYQRGTPVFVDVLESNLLIDPEQVLQAITPQTRAVVAVDYAGHPCDYAALRDICNQHNLVLISDACHAVGGSYDNRAVGSLADLSTFSFHPVKHMTTGEGGMITTDNEAYAQRMRTFRNHGITTDHRQRAENGSWYYEMVDLGYNYRITDFQCALGQSQLAKLPLWVAQRQEIASQYDHFFTDYQGLTPLQKMDNVQHAYHLYVVRADSVEQRDLYFDGLRNQNVGVNLHYIPVHMHPFYQKNGHLIKRGDLQVTEAAYASIITLPIYPGMLASNSVTEVQKRIQNLKSSKSSL